MSKNVAVFVDVANIFYAAKAAGVDIDYVTLLKSASAGRDFIRAYAYTGLDPENENQRQFQSFLARNGYKVVSKDIRKYGDGKVKANLDIELVVDMMKTARNVDIAVLVSGDGDFAPAIRAVQEMGVRVEVISFRGNTSSDLIEAADQFTDITQLAKVERSTRSGRRIAATAEADLSMTAVPDKETEGAPRRRRRTTKATAAETSEAIGEVPAAAGAVAGDGAGRRIERPAGVGAAGEATGPAVRSAAEAIAAAGMPPLRVLPGERLSRIGAEALSAGEPVPVEGAGEPQAVEGHPAEGPPTESAREGEGRRRRRRRGGRGRGRGRGRERETFAGTEPAGETEEGTFEGEGETVGYAPLRPPQSTFGSIWDSQLGMNVPSGRPSAEVGAGEEEIEEPEIPEYLLAERRRAGVRGPRGGRARGPRGGRGAYAAALDRERFGRSAGQARAWSPDRAPRPNRPPGQFRGPARAGAYERSAAAEPWSEVPPDLEEQIRAQLASARPVAQETVAPSAAAPETSTEASSTSGKAEAGRPAGRRGRSTATRDSSRATPARTRSKKAAETAGAAEPAAGESAGSALATAPRRRATRTKAAGEGAATTSAESADAGSAAPEAPKRRTRTRKTAAS